MIRRTYSTHRLLHKTQFIGPPTDNNFTMIEMEARRQRCNLCGAQFLVQPEAQTIQCTVCQAVTRVQPNDHLGQTKDPISQTAGKVKDFIATMSSNFNSMVAAGNNHSMPATTVYGYYSQPVQLPRLVVPSSAIGRRRAVLCGVSYYGTRYRLKGTVNDIRCMRYFLVEKLGFSNDSILVLTEDERDPNRIPTKHNILMALQWLVQGCQSGDSLVFHYSGHGSQQLDFHHDEMDGYDETLLPVDHEIAGMILDDDINAIIVRPLPHGAKLHAIVDACHSGTILDLPFLCRMNREGYYLWEDHSRLSATYKGTSGGLAISLSACDDHQISVDTTSLSGNASTGAMTYSFIQAVQNEPGITYGRLLNAMRHTIREAPTGTLLNGPIGSLVRKVLLPGLSQEPQLSSSEKFDVYSTQFIL